MPSCSTNLPPKPTNPLSKLASPFPRLSPQAKIMARTERQKAKIIVDNDRTRTCAGEPM
jgi:hypothetical protein